MRERIGKVGADSPVSRTNRGAPRASGVRTESRRLSEARRRETRGSGRAVGNRGHIGGGILWGYISDQNDQRERGIYRHRERSREGSEARRAAWVVVGGGPWDALTTGLYRGHRDRVVIDWWLALAGGQRDGGQADRWAGGHGSSANSHPSNCNSPKP